jgi:hypothetical protein
MVPVKIFCGQQYTGQALLMKKHMKTAQQGQSFLQQRRHYVFSRTYKALQNME